MAAALIAPAPALAQTARPPGIRFSTAQAFDAAGVAAYTGRHEEVYRHIDADIADHVAQLQRWMRQQSLSAQNRGIAKMAARVAGDLRQLGFQEVAIVGTKGHPGAFGFHDAGAPRTLVVYMRYDVQLEDGSWKLEAGSWDEIRHLQ